MAKERKKKVQKGDFGYFTAAKKKQALITFVLFAVPLFIFFTAWAYFGSRMTVWTVITTVGCLPACKALVTLIMLLMRKPMKADLYKEISAHQGDLVMAYEMYMTFYQKSGYLDAVAVCGNQVVGYTSDDKVDTAYLEQEAQKIIRKNGYKVNVRFVRSLRPFLERLDSMNANQEALREGIRFVPDEKYPELSREELIRHTILAICL